MHGPRTRGIVTFGQHGEVGQLWNAWSADLAFDEAAWEGLVLDGTGDRPRDGVRTQVSLELG